MKATLLAAAAAVLVFASAPAALAQGTPKMSFFVATTVP